MMWNWHDGWEGWGLIWMGLFMVMFWVPLIFLLFWAIRQFSHPDRGHDVPGSGRAGESDPREIARTTYARGEIDRERFLQIIEDLDRTERKRDAT